MPKNRKILDRLDAGEVIVCDGGMTYALERRGYVSLGSWTPEVSVKHPNALRQIHEDFALCGADVLEAFAFNGTDDNLNWNRAEKDRFDAKEVNASACRIVKEVAVKYNCLVAGPISHAYTYDLDLPKDEKKRRVSEEFLKQVDVFKNADVDFLIAEYIGFVEEAEWAIEIMKTASIPVVMCMCIGPLGDFNGVSVEECAVRMAKAGADIIGVNCRFEPDTAVETVARMKQACEKEGLKVHYICQPVAYRTKDLGRRGFTEAPECPLALEYRLMTRWDMYKYARKAYDAGIRFIGGCCGFEPYHIRAIAEELRNERGGKLPENSYGTYAEMVKGCPKEFQRTTSEYWIKIREENEKRMENKINNNTPDY